MDVAPQSTFSPDDALYPVRLRALARPPPALTVAGGPLDAPCAVAIVGTRACSEPAAAFAYELATRVAQAGAVVISGGAVGIDAAAHRGALSAHGRTWAVCATGRDECFPKEHAALFDEIARGPGAMIWPFADGTAAIPNNFIYRNGVLVALADAVVIVEAGIPSGTYSAASIARKQGRPVWAVAGPPWDPRFAGCRRAIDDGARVVTSTRALLRALGLGDVQNDDTKPAQLVLPPTTARSPNAPRAPSRLPSELPPETRALFEACAAEGRHIDEIAERARVCVREAATGLLTLALENVLVEGPPGFFRRAN
jgi:DNA processing protein